MSVVTAHLCFAVVLILNLVHVIIINAEKMQQILTPKVYLTEVTCYQSARYFHTT